MTFIFSASAQSFAFLLLLHRPTRLTATTNSTTNQPSSFPSLAPSSFPTDEATTTTTTTTFPLTQIRSYNGSEHPSATTGARLLRTSWASYVDGIEDMNDPSRPNPRDVSHALCSQHSGDVKSSTAGLADMVWAFGQFLDHDLDLTLHNEPNVSGVAAIVPTHPHDMLFPMIPFVRSNFDNGTGPGVPRQHVNEITAFIDASNVYGSSQDVTDSLRTFVGGQLLTSQNGRLLPVDNNSGMFLAGDVRANEQMGLTALHTLFVREHNRLADQILAHHPQASDEQIFQLARKLVGAELQKITYDEFLPALFGQRHKLPPYTGYNASVNPGIATEFSTAGFRFGHSMLSSKLLLHIPGLPDAEMPLRNAFFTPSTMQHNPSYVEYLLWGFCHHAAQDVDLKLIDDVRNFLFANQGQGGLDLAALNIQRGRDHGIPRYNDVRDAYGLPRVAFFADVTTDPHLHDALLTVYASPDDMDAWVGCLAEDKLDGAVVGPLIHAILSDQFHRLRAGDVFYYANDIDVANAQHILDLQGDLRLSDIIRWNTFSKEGELRRNVFLMEDDDDDPHQEPTTSPTQTPTLVPSVSPTQAPTTQSPTTQAPTRSPSSSPTTTSPTQSPSLSPTTASPTTSFPSSSPTSSPTRSPSVSPTTTPTRSPSSSPTSSPTTRSPSLSPTTQNPTTSSPTETSNLNTLSPTTSSPTAAPRGYCIYTIQGNSGRSKCLSNVTQDDCDNLPVQGGSVQRQFTASADGCPAPMLMHCPAKKWPQRAEAALCKASKMERPCHCRGS